MLPSLQWHTLTALRLKSVLDASDPHNIEEIAEIDLGKKEDNPTCLAVGKTVDGFTFIYAGVNSSPKDVEKGKNEHFRVYALGKKQQKGKPTIQEVSRLKVFASKDKAAYQRVLRLSRPSAEGIQLGAMATGFADPPELAIFDTANGEKSTGRGIIQLEKEAEDVDVIQTGPEEYSVAYCDKHRVYVKTISAEAHSEDSLCVYEMPDSGTAGKPYIPSFRALRFLTSEFIAVLINHPARGGALIRILRLVPTPSGPQARPAQTLALPSQITQATGFALVNLCVPENAGEKQSNTQFVIAVADQASVSLVAMDYQIIAGNAIVTQPRLLTRIQNVHPLQITGLAFAPFSPTMAKARAPKVLRLGSVSVGNTAVVQSVPLYKPKDGEHYRVALKPVHTSEFTFRKFISVLALLAFAALAQMIMELNHMTPELLNAKERLPGMLRNYFTITPPPVRDWKNEPAGSGGHPTYDAFAAHPIASIIESLRATAADGQPIVVRPSVPDEEPEKLSTFNAGDEAAAQEAMTADIQAKIQARLHDEEAHGPHDGRSWEELSDAQKKEWLERLREMGHWAGELPETLFKGVVFGEMAGAVGRGVAGM